MSKQKLVKPIHLACGNDELRPILSLIKIKEGFAVATNAHIIIKQKLESCSLIDPKEIKNLEGKLIHKNVWKELCDASSVAIEEDKIVAITEAGKTVFEFSEEPNLFPDVESVLDTHTVNATPVCAINPRFVEIFRKVFQTEKLKLNFNGSEKAILVEPLDMEGEFGILMPLAIN